MKNKALSWLLVGIVACVVLFFVVVGIMFSSIARLGGSAPIVSAGSYLYIPLSGRIPEYSSTPDLGPWLSRATTVSDVLRSLDQAADDSRIAGAIVRPTGAAGFAELRELREALAKFRSSGKPVYAHLEISTDRDYYLASVADTVVVSPLPSGGVTMLGLSVASTYLARTFDKVGIKFHVLHAGDSKGNYESLARDSMSVPLRESLECLLDDMYRIYTDEIVKSRPSLPKEVLEHELMDGERLLIGGPVAVEKGFADLTMDWGELREHLSRSGKLKLVHPAQYVKATGATSLSDRKIAVVFAGGEITYGQEDRTPFATNDEIRSSEMVTLLRSLRTNKDIKAVVLRVNSPGGSSLASEVILQEVKRLKAEKPVVVSMGNVAASGGYYISCSANRIIAQPNTVTGSIGVVGVIPTAQELFRKIGARVEIIERGKWAQFFRLDQDLSPEKEAVILDIMSDIYDEFKAQVVVGRSLSADEVEKAAQGRVWTGAQALDLKLVDELGGLDLAIRRAKELAGLTDRTVSLEYFPRQKDIVSYVLRRVLSEMRSLRSGWLLSPEEREFREAVEYLERFARQREFVQAILPVELP